MQNKDEAIREVVSKNIGCLSEDILRKFKLDHGDTSPELHNKMECVFEELVSCMRKLVDENLPVAVSLAEFVAAGYAVYTLEELKLCRQSDAIDNIPEDQEFVEACIILDRFWILKLRDNCGFEYYYTVTGNVDIESKDIEDVKEFLWDTWAKYELSLTPTDILKDMCGRIASYPHKEIPQKMLGRLKSILKDMES